MILPLDQGIRHDALATMIPPIPTRSAFITMLSEPPRWLEESLTGLSPADLDAQPIPGKWSYREFINHIVGVDLGWTDILYRSVRSVRPECPRLGSWPADWKAAYDRRLADGDTTTALAVLRENHAAVADWIGSLSDEDFLHPFPGVLWLIDAGLQVVVADQGRWGLYLHPYYHLAFMQRHRVALGKPLASMERYLHPCPGFDQSAPWPPWTAQTGSAT
jgi:hypothetical protein